MILVKIIQDSSLIDLASADDLILSPSSISRLTTFELTYPRFIHAEFMTHRCFARNSASSRATPIQRMIEQVTVTGDSVFEFWGKNEPGMQANVELETMQREAAKDDWANARGAAVRFANDLVERKVHKQQVNRLLEPFSHITVIATSEKRGLANFFNQRCHPDAQPEMQTLAYRMLNEYLKSNPKEIHYGQWHIPYGDEIASLFHPSLTEMLKIATGRIARVSYLNHRNQKSESDDLALFDKLRDSGHWSPFEHCAMAARADNCITLSCFGPYWRQYRGMFLAENKSTMDPVALMERKPRWLNLEP